MRILNKNRQEPTPTPMPAADQAAAAAPSRQPSPSSSSAGPSISARTSDEGTPRPRGNLKNMMHKLHLGPSRHAPTPAISNSPNLPLPGSALAQGRGAAASMLPGTAMMEQLAATLELNQNVRDLMGVVAERGQIIANLQSLTEALELALHPHGQVPDPSGLAAPKAHERAHPGTRPALDTMGSFARAAAGVHEIKISGERAGVSTSSGPMGALHDRAQQRLDARLGEPAVGTGKAQPEAALDLAGKLPKGLGDKYLNASKGVAEAVDSAEKQYGTDHAAFPPDVQESISGKRAQQEAVLSQAMTHMLFPKQPPGA
jgi:hypothetical protein